MIDLGARLERSDRHVRRSRLQLRDAGARARVEFALSETLRLVNLPGEDQGRVYYFRRVNVKDVPADGNRAMWLDKVQSALSELAARAMHGSDRRAIASDVVFFHSQVEALELLLRKVVKRESFAEWFCPLVSRCESDVSRGEQIAAIVERLRELPASWNRVAQVLFALGDDDSPLDVAAALPVASVARWLRELGAEGVDETFAPGLLLPEVLERLGVRAVRRFGREDPRTIWLASLAVLLVAPPRLGSSIVAHARATLRRIEATRVRNGDLETDQRGKSSAIVFDEASTVAETARPTEVVWSGERTADQQVVDERAFDEREFHEQVFDEPSLDERASGAVAFDAAFQDDGHSPADVPSPAASVRRAGEPAISNWESDSRAYFGAHTGAAGLYFLLNPMARLGIAAAAVDLRFAQARVAARVLRHLAAHAGVEPSDPILTWVNEEIEWSNEAFASLQLDAAAWPVIFGAAPRGDLDAQYVARAWALAVRRWCWCAGRLSVREIVNRSGRVLSNRTDIDVSLALEDADVRIRRVGLDIDPGWLPWFGCVVRFHYVREEPRP